jgi:septal ring factor EnvC (AmiA/AmiB activator)
MFAGAPHAVRAQSAEQRLRQQQEELDAIRKERADLQRRLDELQGQAHDLTEEATNIRKQADATARIVRSLDAQLITINEDVDSTTAAVQRAEQRVDNQRGALRARLASIYKRGPLFTFEALLSARSFGELLGRYKYLHELAVNDRRVVGQVESSKAEIEQHRALVLRLQAEVIRNREEKASEMERLRRMEGNRRVNLVTLQQSRQVVEQRILRIKRDESRLTSLLAELEESRRRAESASPSSGPSSSTLRAADAGKLDWPVQGEIVYSYGRQVSPDNTAIRWNGVGISAPSGTAVKSVAEGEVVLVQTIGTYGLTVFVQHGDGDYSVYASLSRADVAKGQRVSKGQVIGAVGRADPDMAPHLHFEVRPKGRAVDPLSWLRNRQ